jgi:hypothetical protein
MPCVRPLRVGLGRDSGWGSVSQRRRTSCSRLSDIRCRYVIQLLNPDDIPVVFLDFGASIWPKSTPALLDDDTRYLEEPRPRFSMCRVGGQTARLR